MISQETNLNNFYEELEKLKNLEKGNYKEGMVKIDLGEIEKRKSQSKHLLDFKDLEIDPNWLEGYFKKFLLTLKRFETEDEFTLKRLEEGFEKKELNLANLVKRVFCFDSKYLENVGKKMMVDKDYLYFLGKELAQPVFELYREKLEKEVKLGSWTQGNCLVCGSLPAIAYLRNDDGKRILWCQFCKAQWSFLRIKCPFCLNEEHNSLKYFFTEEKSFYRIDVCDKCKRYIKTIDQRKMPNPDKLSLDKENIESYFLDLLAQKEGYLNALS